MADVEAKNTRVPSIPSKDEVASAYQKLVEGLTGAGSSRPTELIRSAGHLLQRVRGVGWLNAFAFEWDKLREKGRIAEDYSDSSQHQECFQELLDSLDDPGATDRRFAILKKILLVAASESHSTRDSVLPQQYMATVRSLSTGEILVVEAAFRRTRDTGTEIPANYVAAGQWLKEIAELSGLRHVDLVHLHEKTLVAKGLISPRSKNDVDVYLKPAFRLTPYAVELLEFIERYEEG